MLAAKQGKVVTMPRGPKGEHRARDVIGSAVHVMRIATGQTTDDVPTLESEGKDPAAVALGRKGGEARAKKLSKSQRSKIAKKAARSRWRDTG
jgi:hypothetical protein